MRFPRVGGSEFPAFDLYVCTAELAIFFASVLAPLSFRFGGSTKVRRSAIQVFLGKYYLVRVWRFSSETPAPRTWRAEIRGHNFAAQTERPETDRKKWQFASKTTYMRLELGSPTWWEADSLVTVKRKLERAYYGCVGTSLQNESLCKGERLAVNREKQGQQAHETSVHWKGRTNDCHLPDTSDVLLWGLPISRLRSMSLPLTVGEEKDMECCMPGCFSVSFP